MRYNRPGADYRTIAYGDSVENDDAKAQPHAVADVDIATRFQGLLLDQFPRLYAVVVGVKRTIGSYRSMFPNRYMAYVGHDLAAWVQECIGTDRNRAALPGLQHRVPKYVRIVPDDYLASVPCLVDNDTISNECMGTEYQTIVINYGLRIDKRVACDACQVKPGHVGRSKRCG